MINTPKQPIGNAPVNGATIKHFIPLIAIVGIIVCITLAHQLAYGWDFMQGMRIMMAAFFLIYSALKLVNLAGFAATFSGYNPIAQRFYWYGYAYPFIELGLGLAYLFNVLPFGTNLLTFALMLIDAAGVWRQLRKGTTVTCACLGAVFKMPVTYATLAEDLIMAAMAGSMLLM